MPLRNSIGGFLISRVHWQGPVRYAQVQCTSSKYVVWVAKWKFQELLNFRYGANIFVNIMYYVAWDAKWSSKQESFIFGDTTS